MQYLSEHKSSQGQEIPFLNHWKKKSSDILVTLFKDMYKREDWILEKLTADAETDGNIVDTVKKLVKVAEDYTRYHGTAPILQDWLLELSYAMAYLGTPGSMRLAEALLAYPDDRIAFFEMLLQHQKTLNENDIENQEIYAVFNILQQRFLLLESYNVLDQIFSEENVAVTEFGMNTLLEE